MNSTKLGAILAGLIASQTLGATTVQYTLEVGGDNHTSDWKNPPGTCLIPFFTSGTTANGSSQPCILTWAAKVSVTGTYSVDTLAPLGVANVVFNVELRDGTDTPVASFGKGTATTKGFFSSINDGTANSAVCYASPDPDEAVSFPVSFTATGAWNGRLIDSSITGGNDTGGPGLTYFQYPSALAFPGTSTCPTATLCGVGAGYPSYTPNGCPDNCGAVNGFAMPGLGYYTGNPIPAALEQGGSCNSFFGSGPGFGGHDGLGDVAIIEGQINMDTLIDGTYKLVLTPGAGTNLIKGGFDCQTDPGAFAVAAATTGGDTVVGDEITFTIGGCAGGTCTTRTIAGRSIYYNNSFFDGNTAGAVSAVQENGAIAPNKSVLLPGGVAALANVTNYSRGVNGLVVDIAPGPNCTPLSGAIDPANLSFMTGNDSNIGAFSPAAIVPVSVTAFPGAGAGGSDRIYIILPDQPASNPPLNTRWLRTTLKSTANGGTLQLAADDVFYVGWAKGEAGSVGGGFALVNSTDVNAIKTNPHTSLNPTVITDATDNNKDTLVNTTDANNALTSQTTSLNGLKLITAP